MESRSYEFLLQNEIEDISEFMFIFIQIYIIKQMYVLIWVYTQISTHAHMFPFSASWESLETIPQK